MLIENWALYKDGTPYQHPFSALVCTDFCMKQRHLLGFKLKWQIMWAIMLLSFVTLVSAEEPTHWGTLGEGLMFYAILCTLNELIPF